MSEKRRFILTVLTAVITVLGTGGCSRSVINYQIAECIGTVGEYENNEPVETPKMQAERELEEAEEAEEEECVAVLEEAELLASGYWYEEAIALLEETDLLEEDERAEEAIATYQSELDALTEYEGDVVHLNFPNLIADTSLAFDGDSYAQTYSQNMITISEFEGILNQLYENGYILIDIHSLAEETDDGFGDITMTAATLTLPDGKKPLVISVENLNYASVRSGDGVATNLVLDSDGEVAAVYTDSDGVRQTGAYDVVPVLEQFIEEHPDFSYRGARGIIGLSGKDGVFGYEVEEDSDEDWESNAETVKQIAEKLIEDGWTFAAEGYSYSYMSDMTYDELEEDITQWESVVGSLIGDCDTLIYPYGSEVDYTSEKVTCLTAKGYRYLIGLWASDDYLAVNQTYLRQTRRAITGYILENCSDYFTDFFDVSVILDAGR
ncbi:MAG: polysaccharide deacetylase family protein [Lachnospiraceae bacterium]|nr:polysaccharide deacetylase family protein [Lachnospiraceae bacterium]